MKIYNSLHFKQGVPSQIHGVGVFSKCLLPRGSKILFPRKGLINGFNSSCDPNVINDIDHWAVKVIKDIQI